MFCGNRFEPRSVSTARWEVVCLSCNSPEARARRGLNHQPAGPLVIDCGDCGQPFRAEGRGSGKRRYCDACMAPDVKRRRNNRGSPDVEKECIGCSKKFTVPARPHNRLYCDDCQISVPAEMRKLDPFRGWSPERKRKAREAQKRWNEKNPEKHKRGVRSSRLQRQYGLTVEQVEQMHRDQDGRCSLCLDEIEVWSRDTHIDHNHETGVVRGLLCGNCNRGLGYLKDSAAVLRRAAEYVERYAVVTEGVS